MTPEDTNARDKRIQEGEDLILSRPQRLGVAKGLFTTGRLEPASVARTGVPTCSRDASCA